MSIPTDVKLKCQLANCHKANLSKQRDQIGLFLQGFSDKFYSHCSPNFLLHLGLLLKKQLFILTFGPSGSKVLLHEARA